MEVVSSPYGFLFTDEVLKWFKEHGLELEDSHYISRHNPLLVQCIKELKKKETEDYYPCGDAYIVNIVGSIYRVAFDSEGIEHIETPYDYNWIISDKSISLSIEPQSIDTETCKIKCPLYKKDANWCFNCDKNNSIKIKETR